MRIKSLLAATTLVGASLALVVPRADACVWAIGSTAAPNTMLGTSFTQAGAASPGTTCGSSLTFNANGTPNGTGPDPVQLFNKQAGAGETGLGLTNDPSGDKEVTPGNSIIIDVSNVVGRTGTMALSVNADSVQSPDMWELLDSHGNVLIAPNGSSGTEMSFTTSDTLLTFTATAGNVLLDSFDSPEGRTPPPPPPIPEPTSLALLGSALVGFGWVCRRRRSTAAR